MTSTRQAIIESAYETFYRQGFHASGVETLAEQAGVTKRTLYAHFGSKDGLIVAVLEYRHDQFIKKLLSALEQYPKQETVDAYLAFIECWTGEPNFCGCLFLHACAEYTDPNSKPYRIAQAHKAQIRQIIKERLELANIDNAKRHADYAFLLGEGMISAMQTGQKNLSYAYQGM